MNARSAARGRARRGPRAAIERGRQDPRLERLTLAALAACGVMGYIAAFLVISQQSLFGESDYYLPGLAMALYILPLTHVGLTRTTGRTRRRGVLEFLVIAAQLGLLAALAFLGPVEFLMGVAALLLGHFLGGWHSSTQSVGVVILTLTLTHISRGVIPGRPTLYLLLSSFPAAVLALGCIHSRHVRRIGLRVRPKQPHPYESLGALGARLLGTLLVAVVCLLVALTTHHLTNVQPREGDETAAEESDAGGEQERREDPGQTDPQDEDQPREDSGAPISLPPDPPGDGQQSGEEPPDDGGGDPTPPPDQPDSSDAPDPADDTAGGGSDRTPDPDLLDLVQSLIDPSQPGIRYVAVPDYARGRYEAVVEDVREHPWKLILAILTQLLLIAWILRRHLRKALTRRGIRLPGQSRSDFYFDKLLIALEGYGHRIRDSQTPREFTRSVVRVRGRLFEPCNEIAALVYRSHYGDQELTAEERRHIESIITRLENRELTAVSRNHPDIACQTS